MRALALNQFHLVNILRTIYLCATGEALGLERSRILGKLGMMVPKQEDLEVEACLSYKWISCPQTVHGWDLPRSLPRMDVVLGKTVTAQACWWFLGWIRPFFIRLSLKGTDHKFKSKLEGQSQIKPCLKKKINNKNKTSNKNFNTFCILSTYLKI